MNLPELTTEKVANLAAAVNNEHNELDRKLKPDMVTLVKQGLQSGNLNRAKMNQQLLGKLAP